MPLKEVFIWEHIWLEEQGNKCVYVSTFYNPKAPSMEAVFAMMKGLDGKDRPS